MMAPVPPLFDPDGNKYDQATYRGRLLHFLDVIDPRMLLVGDEQLKESQARITRFRQFRHHQGVDSGGSDAELWQAKKVQDALLHPDTGEKILLPLRMSAFVPVGIIFVLGMLRPNPSLRSAIFWQWANQSSNATINYANRNATADETDGSAAVRTMFESYCVAVAGSCGIAFGATKALGSARAKLLPPKLRSTLSLFVPLVSVCSANSFSLCVIRRRELTNGIELTDESGEAVGHSKIAARKAMTEMVLSRGMLLPSTVLGIPPVIMAVLDRICRWSPTSKARLGAQVVTVVGALGVMLPLALAVFPQKGSLARAALEPQFRNSKGSTSGENHSALLYYNKGL